MYKVSTGVVVHKPKPQEMHEDPQTAVHWKYL